MEFFDFEYIIQLISRKIRVKNYEQQDLAQALSVKVIEILPKLQEIPPKEAFKLCNTVLKNHAIDLHRKETGYRVKRQYVSMNDVESSIAYEIEAIMGLYESDFEDSLALKQVKGLILKWANKQADDVKIFLHEMVNPSPQTLAKHEEIIAKQVRKSDIDFISPYHLRLILGLSNRKWRQVQTYLQRYLIAHGYSLQDITRGSRSLAF